MLWSALVVNTIFLEVHGILIAVSGLGLQRILMAINRMRHDIRALIVIRIPISISIDVSVAVYPSVNAFSCRVFLVFVQVRILFVLTVHGDGWHMNNFRTLRMILQNLPVLPH